MKQQLTETEISKIQNMCFENPRKSCAIAQLILDTCQIVSCSTYARLHKKSKRTVLYQSKHMTGVNVEDRKFIALCS